jgi:hypothetical protein
MAEPLRQMVTEPDRLFQRIHGFFTGLWRYLHVDAIGYFHFPNTE